MTDLVKAYLDDYHRITVEISKRFCEGKSEVFYLSSGSEFMPLELQEKTEHNDRITYTLKLYNDIEIGRKYEVLVKNAFRTVMEYRFIVKTKRFEREFRYSNHDLGCKVDKEHVYFNLWAPTASDVKLEITYRRKTRVINMVRTEKGVFRLKIKPNLLGASYCYLVEVNGRINRTTDPYARCSSPNGRASIVCSYRRYAAEKARLGREEAIIYETSVRDYSPEGTFRGFTDLEYLQKLGITYLQLMPVNDFGSVDELNPSLFYNWGYDPVQYMALEESYSSNPSDPEQVLKDFSDLVNRIHSHGIRVSLDVVFNHMYVMNRSSFELTVPYYFFRYYPDGQLSDGSYCGNDFDSTMNMARKYIVDALSYYVDMFDIDAFRFDLMGILDIDTMNEINKVLRKKKESILLYGEGWAMPTALSDDQAASKNNQDKMPDIGFFNDSFRETIKGSTFDVRKRGFGTGHYDNKEAVLNNLQGKTLKNSINYVECHDDMTCYDKIRLCLLEETPETWVRRQKFILSCVILAKGTAFIHSGQEACRSKNGYANTYNMPDEINKLNKSDREKYRDVVEYVSRLIRFRRERKLSEREYLNFEFVGDCIVLNIDEIKIIFNPSLQPADFSLEHEYVNLSGRAANAFTVEGISTEVLVRKDDQ